MRILLSIHHHLDRNAGAPGSVMEIAEALGRLGHDVRIHSFDDLPDSWPEQLKMIVYPWAFGLFCARHARSFDVVEACTGDAWVWSLLRRQGSRPPLVVSSQGIEHLAHQVVVEEARAGRIRLSRKYPIYHGGWRLREVETTLRRSDAAFFLNEAERAYCVKRFNIDGSSAHVIHHALPEELLGLPPPSPTPDRRIRVAQIGTYMHQKGTAWAAQALTSLMSENRDVEVTFLGTKRSPRLVLADFNPVHHERIGVIECFNRADLPHLLAGHQIVLLPTLSEGFGMALLEGMACGLAPVSTKVAGPMEFVSHGQNGLLVSPGDVRELLRALGALADDNELLTRLRGAAYATAQLFTWPSNALQRLSIYGSLVA